MIYWEHSDARGMAGALSDATTRAHDETGWTTDHFVASTGDRVADMRALVIGTWHAAERMQAGAHARPLAQLGSLSLDSRDYTHADRRASAVALSRSFALLVPGAAADIPPPPPFRTTGGTGPENLALRDAGAPPLVAITIAAAVSLSALALIWSGRDAAEIIDRYLARKADLDDREAQRRAQTARLVSAHAGAVELAAQHVAREAEAGRELPLSPAHLDAMALLRTTQDRALQPEKPLEKLPPMPHAADWLLPAALLGGGLYLFSRQG